MFFLVTSLSRTLILMFVFFILQNYNMLKFERKLPIWTLLIRAMMSIFNGDK